jgi:hypothetical protein
MSRISVRLRLPGLDALPLPCGTGACSRTAAHPSPSVPCPSLLELTALAPPCLQVCSFAFSPPPSATNCCWWVYPITSHTRLLPAPLPFPPLPPFRRSTFLRRSRNECKARALELLDSQSTPAMARAERRRWEAQRMTGREWVRVGQHHIQRRQKRCATCAARSSRARPRGKTRMPPRRP